MAEAGRCAAGEAGTQVAVADTDFAKVCCAGDSPSLDDTGALGLHLSHGKCTGLAVAGTDRVNYHGDPLVPLEQTESRCQHCVFGVGADQNEFACAKLSEQSFYPRLIKGVRATFMQDYLVIVVQKPVRQVGVAVRRKTYPPPQQCVLDFSLTLCAVQTIVNSAAAVVIGINLAGRDDGDIIVPRPSYHPSKVRQDPAVISDTGFACSEENVLLSAYVYQDPSTARFHQLPDHVSSVSP